MKPAVYFIALILVLFCSNKSFGENKTLQHGSRLSDTTDKMKTAFEVIEKMYLDYAAKNHIPGLAFGIVVDGKLVYSKGFGYSDVEHHIPVTTSSVFRIASMTKSFTAMAILKLRDAGKLRLDDPVYQYIPEIKNTRPLTPDSPPITIRNLLTHSAGFPEDNPWGDRQLQRTDKELVDFIKKGISLSSPPGLNYEYSNLGFAMLGHIVTAVSGEPFEKYINKNIIAPLRMQHTYWEYTDVPTADLANGYRFVNEKWLKEEMLHSGAYGAMGGMLTSIEDFARYIALHISAWPPGIDDSLVVKRSTLREMHGPGKLSYLIAQNKNSQGIACPKISSYNDGLGYTKDCNGREMIGHSGGLPGFGSNWTMLPQYGIGLVSFCNLTYAATNALNLRIADTLIAICLLKPRAREASAILEKRKKELIKFLPDWNGAEKSGIFSENFFLDYFTDSLKKDARTLFARAGRIVSVSGMIPDNELRGNFILRGQNADLLVRFTLSPENPPLIQEYHISALPKTDSAFLKYGLRTISSMGEYQALVSGNPDQELVSLEKMITGIKLDIRYATSNNIMKQPLYNISAAYMRLPPARALRDIQAELKTKGYGLKIYDGYRPYAVTVKFYEKFQDSVFVASPYTGSRHNRGCAVDLTLIDLKTGRELKMPTPYDSFTKEAHTNYPEPDPEALRNREVLKSVMTRHGFLLYPDEWWHFDFDGWNKYPLMDISFENLRDH